MDEFYYPSGPLPEGSQGGGHHREHERLDRRAVCDGDEHGQVGADGAVPCRVFATGLNGQARDYLIGDPSASRIRLMSATALACGNQH
jgi:hypothetical protein